MDNLTLSRLFERIRHGDKAAFSDMYSALKAPVYTVILRIVRTQEAAEDVMQEVFLKLYREPPDENVKNLRAWIFAAARNRAIDALRSSSPEELISEDIPSPRFEHTSLTRIDLGRVMELLKLSEREVISLHLTAGLTIKDTAKIMKLSPSAAYRLYRRALKRLRDELS